MAKRVGLSGYWIEVAPPVVISPLKLSTSPTLETIREEEYYCGDGSYSSGDACYQRICSRVIRNISLIKKNKNEKHSVIDY